MTKQQSPSTDAEWWTTAEVAAHLGVAVSTISAYRNRGQMPAPDRKIGRTQLWRPQTIIDWQRARPGSGYWR